MKLKYQIFTPQKVVEEMLDKLNYCNNLYGKKVLESSCGDGNILLFIVKRYIVSSINENFTLDEIKLGLEKDIYAVEIDPYYYNECLVNLEKLSSNFGINNVNWNLFNHDRLRQTFELKFDYIIGNPPYIKYHDLESKNRLFLKTKYKSCSKGNFDYYYAFLEEDLHSLNETGKMAYLVPSNIFKNVHANELRSLIKENLIAIYDYTNQRIFKDILTSSSVIIIDKSTNTDHCSYHDLNKNKLININKASLHEKWIFKKNFCNEKKTVTFGEYFEASMPVATLLNEAYILRDYKETENFYEINQKKIEKNLVKDAASPRSIFLGREEKIIFPYFYNNGELLRYKPEAFEHYFPHAVKYLKDYTDRLAKRNSSPNIYWYEYGRTQALKHLNQPKLLISTVITKKIKVYDLDQNSVPYSGIYIIPKQGMNLEIAKEILETKSFLDYITSMGINVNSNSIRITARDINNFPINKIIE